MIDKEAFLKAALPEQAVEVSAGTVRVRALTRLEQLDLQRLADNLPSLETHIIAAGLVDPALTLAEVVDWYGQAPAGDADRVVKAIADLSGMTEGAPKSGVSGVRSEPGS